MSRHIGSLSLYHCRNQQEQRMISRWSVATKLITYTQLAVKIYSTGVPWDSSQPSGNKVPNPSNQKSIWICISHPQSTCDIHMNSLDPPDLEAPEKKNKYGTTVSRGHYITNPNSALFFGGESFKITKNSGSMQFDSPKMSPIYSSWKLDGTVPIQIGLWGPFTSLPFGSCAIYFDLKVMTPGFHFQPFFQCKTTSPSALTRKFRQASPESRSNGCRFFSGGKDHRCSEATKQQ